MKEGETMAPWLEKDALFSQFPDIWNVEKERVYREAVNTQKKKIVVLDDDPTGIQTVHDIYVYTDWSRESLLRGMEGKERVFFILTNSRAMSREKTIQVHRELAGNLMEASQKTGNDFLLVSRGDSTLRGHYPVETETLREGLEAGGMQVDGEILCPFFEEGGRYTVNDVHYLEIQDGRLQPVGTSEFAKDSSFSYQSSDLKEWIEEKYEGKVGRQEVLTVTLEELRAYDIPSIAKKLAGVSDFRKVVVNAVCYADLKVFVIALMQAMAQGKRYLFRSAASLVRVLGGIGERPLLEGKELPIHKESAAGGLIVAGSHVQRTTAQLEALHKKEGLRFLEFSVIDAADEEKFRKEIKRIGKEVSRLLQEGESVVFYTSRQRIDAPGQTQEENLALSVRISEAVTEIVAGLPLIPRYLVAKGGITSSDIGTKALQVKRAFVPGQILPGVPVWITGEESRFPGIPYIIFPGNVGTTDALFQIVEKLERETRPE